MYILITINATDLLYKVFITQNFGPILMHVSSFPILFNKKIITQMKLKMKVYYALYFYCSFVCEDLHGYSFNYKRDNCYLHYTKPAFRE